MCPPSHRPMINIQSTLRTSPGLCKNVSLAVLFGSNINSYTSSKQTEMCTYTYTHMCTVHRRYSSKRNIKTWDSSKIRAPRKSFRVPQARQPCPILCQVSPPRAFLIRSPYVSPVYYCIFTWPILSQIGTLRIRCRFHSVTTLSGRN